MLLEKYYVIYYWRKLKFNQQFYRTSPAIIVTQFFFDRFMSEYYHSQVQESSSVCQRFIVDKKYHRILILHDITDMIKILACLLVVVVVQGRWSEQQAARWYSQYTWSAGVNYIPAYAVNQIEMWQQFNQTAIDTELRWASNIGFTKLRVFLHVAPFQAHPNQFMDKMATFVSIAKKNNQHVIFVLFDDCWKPEYHLGQQPEPTPGVHNSQWVQCPGTVPIQEAILQNYVTKILTRFKSDENVVLWDLYNEVGNSKHGVKSLPLLRKIFQWARAVNPNQPLSSCHWVADIEYQQLNHFILTESDVITFHAYCDKQCTINAIHRMKTHKRPVICTEYMARPMLSHFVTHLPVFKEYNVWAINWGFVYGRTQTYYPWWSKQGDPVPKQWFHDVVHPDGTPFNSTETDFIKKITALSAQEIK